MKIVVTEEQLKKVINSSILKETVGELDKQYVKTGLFDDEERNLIIGITGGDYYTKLIADMYKYLANKYNPGAVEPRKVNDHDLKILRHAHEMLKRYNKNVFPLKDLFAKDYYTHPLGIRNDLELRELIIDRIKAFPTLLLRNLRGDIRKERGEYEFPRLFDTVRDIQNSLKLVNQTNPEHRAKIEKKIFSSTNDTFEGVLKRLQDTTIPYLSQNDAGEVVIDKVQDLGDEAEVLYNKDNVIVVKINTAEAMGYIGCSSQWCFATNPQGYWDDYTSGDDGFATIVFNFNEQPSEPTAMVVVLETGDVYNMYNDFMEDGYEYLHGIGVEEVIPHGSMEMSENYIIKK